MNFNRDFSTKTIARLAKRGITIVGITMINGNEELPFANGETGYCLDNNGMYQIRTFGQVLALAQ